PADGALAGDLLLATVPDFADLTKGCVQRIDVTDLAVTCLVENEALGGFASGIAVGADGIWFAAVSGFAAGPDDFGAIGRLVRLEPDSLEVVADIGRADHRPFDVAVCPTGHVVTADAAGGVRVHGAGGAEGEGELL